jgi:hypothetical protein
MAVPPVGTAIAEAIPPGHQAAVLGAVEVTEAVAVPVGHPAEALEAVDLAVAEDLIRPAVGVRIVARR